MQVVGSSFASLPGVSQHVQQSQPSHLGRSQASNTAGNDMDGCSPEHLVDGPSKRQTPTPENTSNPNKESSSPQEEDILPDQNDSEHVQVSRDLPF